MPAIRSSADLREDYDEVSEFCHTYGEPVFISENGERDLVVMSIDAHVERFGRFELYGLVLDGLADVRDENTRPFSAAMADIRARRNG